MRCSRSKTHLLIFVEMSTFSLPSIRIQTSNAKNFLMSTLRCLKIIRISVRSLMHALKGTTVLSWIHDALPQIPVNASSSSAQLYETNRSKWVDPSFGTSVTCSTKTATIRRWIRPKFSICQNLI